VVKLKKNQKHAFLTVRLQDELMERLHEVAEMNERTVSSEARLAIRAHLDRGGGKESKNSTE
jgi:predicted transcriptional regulator